MKISLFVPCLVDQVAPETARATVRVLEKLGHEVRYNANQTCCGQALFNAGFRHEARKLAKKFISLFNNADVIVAPSGSCISMVRNHYAELELGDDIMSEWLNIKD